MTLRVVGMPRVSLVDYFFIYSYDLENLGGKAAGE